MTAPAPAPEFPQALAEDHDDVAWALQTGVVQWNRGGYEDALVWLRRAVDAALQNGAYDRASELTRITDVLEDFVEDRPLQQGADVDDLIAGRASLPEVEIGGVEYATQSLVDAAELMGGDMPTDTDVRLPEAFDVDVSPEVLDGDEIEVLDDEELEELPEELPAAQATPPPPRAAPPAPPPRRPPPVPPPPAASTAPKSAGARKPPEPQRVYPSPFDPPEPADEYGERKSSPASQPYVAEAFDETTHRRSAAELAYGEEEAPTGVRPFDAEALADSDPEASAEPEVSSEPEAPSEPAETESDEVVVAEPSSPVAEFSDATQAQGPLVEDEELEVPAVEKEEISTDEAETPLVAAVAEPAGDEAEPAGDDAEPAIGGVKLADVRGLEDLPPETQAELAARARVEVLGPDEEVSAFGLALVLKGSVSVMPAIADVACARAGVGEPVFCRGNLAEGVAMRVVAQGEGAEVAVWQVEDFENAIATCPWVAEELRAVADRFQALAGATMGPLGDNLDESMRALVTERTEVKLLEPGEELLVAGKPLPGLHIVGAGRLEVDGGDEALPGDLLFPQLLLAGGATPKGVRAGAQGALVLFVDRASTTELMMSVPPLLELLASA